MADQDILAALNNAVQAINNLNQTMSTVFPQTTGTAATATGGAATLPANPVGFLAVTNPTTGASIKVPYYNP